MPTFLETLQRAQDGDEVALEVLMNDFGRVVQCECRDARDWMDASTSHADVMQEVWIRVWSRIEQFRGDGAGDDEEIVRLVLKKWLRQTTRNVLRSLITRNRAARRYPRNGVGSLTDSAAGRLPASGDETPSGVVGREEESGRVRAAIGVLDEESQTVITKHVDEGLTFAQIAEQMELSADQVRYRFHQALKKLEASLGR